MTDDDDLTIDGADLMATILAERAQDAHRPDPSDDERTLDPIPEGRPTRAEPWRPSTARPEPEPPMPTGYPLPVVIGAFVAGSLLGSAIVAVLP